MTETILTTTTLFLAAIWLFFIIIYAYKNDFSADILSFFLPALGAILLSFFVGIKFIWIDNPSKTETFRCTAAVLIDESTCAIHGEALKHNDYSKKTINRDGLYTIYNYENHVSLNDLVKVSDEVTAKRIFDCIEYKILEWLRDINAVQGSWYNQEYTFTMLGGGWSEKADSIVTSKMISEYKVDENSFPYNELFKRNPIICNLPSKSSITSLQKNTYNRNFKIHTKYSEIEFSMQQIGSGRISNSAPIYNEIAKSIVMSNKDARLIQFSYQIEIKQKLYSFTRFAKEAKLHPEWFILLITKFKEAFAFEALKEKERLN